VKGEGPRVGRAQSSKILSGSGDTQDRPGGEAKEGRIRCGCSETRNRNLPINVGGKIQALLERLVAQRT